MPSLALSIRDQVPGRLCQIVTESQLLSALGQVLRPGTSPTKTLTREGVHKAQAKSVQRLTRQATLGASAVQGVGPNGIPLVGQVHTNLMRPAGVELTIDQGGVLGAFDRNTRRVGQLS